MTETPSPKRIKLENSPSKGLDQELEEVEHCPICLQEGFADRTVIPHCAHEFCFECLLIWSEKSRKCPLCSQAIGEFVIHRVRSRHNYQKYFLPPLRTSPPPPQDSSARRNHRRAVRDREWGRRERQQREEADELDRAIARRRWIYEHDLYSKHVASNSFTRYRPYPTPAQFAGSPDLISRMTTFLRRELRVWMNLDVEFLTTFIISLMKSIDIRSESAVRLIAEFLDMDAPYEEGSRHVNAEHFAHEVYCYLRSPYRDLFVYDSVVQYDVPEDLPPLAEYEQRRRWRDRTPSRVSSRSPSPRPRSQSPRQREPYTSHESRQRGAYYEHKIRSPHPPGREITREDTANGDERKRDESRQCDNIDKIGKEADGRDITCLDGNSRSSLQQAESAVSFNTNLKEDQKGKQRAEIAESTSIFSPHIEDVSDSTSLVRARVPSRAPRNRNLAESVQAHLGPRSKETVYPPHVHVPGRPPLLERLSGVDTQVKPSPTVSVNASNDDGRQTKGPGTMARTHAQLVKLEGKEVSRLPKLSASGPGDLSCPPFGSLDGKNENKREEKVGHSQGSGNGISEENTPSDLRAKLLERLQEEKQQTQAPVHPVFTDEVEIPLDPSSGVDSQAAETRLRTQAQLRVRLAAAKREAGGTGGIGGHADSGDDNREGMLRARLRERRN